MRRMDAHVTPGWGELVLMYTCTVSQHRDPLSLEKGQWPCALSTYGRHGNTTTWGMLMKHTHAYTHSFNGPLSRTTRVSRHQKCKTSLDFTGARDSEWQWHLLGHMQVCTSLQTDNHASNPPLSFYRPDALPAAQPTASTHWRQPC